MTDNSSVPVQSDPDDESLGMLDLLVICARNKILVFGLPFVSAVIAAIYAYQLPDIYTASTRILPPQQGQSSATAVLAQIVGGSALGGMAGLKNPGEVYVAILKSRTLADSMIQRFELNKIYPIPTDARNALGGASSIALGRDGVISVDVDDKDPKRATELANAYIEELYKLTSVLAVTEASQRRLFYERQLFQAKDKLAGVEVAARQQLEQGGVVKIDDQGRAMITTSAQWRAKISAQEVQISAMRSFASEDNPDLKLAQRELDAMRNELAKFEGGRNASDSGRKSSTDKGLNNLRLLRDLKYYETLYDLLAKQFELAKMDEARDASLIQVLDRAVQPDRRSKPKRTIIVLTIVAAVGALAVLLAIVKEWLVRVRQVPEQARKMQLIRNHLLGN